MQPIPRAYQSPNAKLAQSNRRMRTRTYCSQLTNQSFHSYLCHQQTHDCPTVLGVKTRYLWSLAHCPSVYTILAARGVRLHFYSCWWSKKFFGGTSGRIRTLGQSFTMFCLSLPRFLRIFSEGSDTHFIQDFPSVNPSE